jgi:hypothetical protein
LDLPYESMDYDFESIKKYLRQGDPSWAKDKGGKATRKSKIIFDKYVVIHF